MNYTNFYKVLFVVIIGLSVTSIGRAQKYSNEFLSIGIGAGAMGMGNATVAGVNDVTATYWNPAGLATIPNENGVYLGAMHAEWFAGVSKHDYLAATIPMAKEGRRLAISLIRNGIDGIPNTLSLYNDDGSINYDNVTEFSAADYAIMFSHARNMNVKKGKLYVGGNAKVIYRGIGRFATSWGFGIDLGLQYHLNKWKFGFMGNDITTTFNAWSINFTDSERAVLEASGNDVTIKSLEITKPRFTLGARRSFSFKKVELEPEVDVIFTTDGQRNTLVSSKFTSIDLAIGLQALYNDFLSVRAGVSQFQKSKNFDGKESTIMSPSFGIGLKLGLITVDYAYTNPSDGNNRFSHIVSLTYNMRPKKG